MPAPILKVPVDDSAFQKYLEAFKKYQKQLESQPDMWRDISASAAGFAAAGAAVAEAIFNQADATSELSDEQKKLRDAEAEAVKARERADRAQADRDKEASRRRREALSQLKEYSSKMLDIARMGGGALMGLALGGGIGLFGLEKIAAGVGNQRRNAQGLGVSVGEQQGLNLNASRYFDVNSTLSRVADARSDPAQYGTLRMLGIDANSKMGTAEMTEKAALAARRLFKADNGNIQLAQARGLTNIFSVEDLRRLIAPGNSEADIKKSFRDANGNAGFADGVGKKWQDLSIRVERFGLVLENVLINKLTALSGPVGDVLDGLQKMAVEFVQKLDFKAIGNDIEWFATKISSPEFQNGFKGFIDGLANLVPTMKTLKLALDIVLAPVTAAQAAGSAIGGVAGDAYIDAKNVMGSGPNSKKNDSWLTKGMRFLESNTAKNIANIASLGSVPGLIMQGIFGAESSFGSNMGNSKAGARGGFQFMPATAARFGVANRDDLTQEAQGATKYMATLLKMFGGDQQKALAAYNWGEGHVQRDIAKNGSNWLAHAPKETQDYVGKIMAFEERARSAQSGKPTSVKVTTTLKNQTGASVAHQVNASAGG